LFRGDNNKIGLDIARQCTPWHYGLVLHDSNCFIDLPLLQAFQSTRLDVLIYYTGTLNKRVRGAYSKQQNAPGKVFHRIMKQRGVLAEEIINANIKQHWVIREPHGKDQWTFLWGSNWEKFQSFRWDKQGFFPVTSAEGIAILNYINSFREGKRQNIYREAMRSTLARSHQLPLWGNL
jgi:hypothetical protein